MCQILGGLGDELRSLVLKSSIKRLAKARLRGDLIAAPFTCSKYIPWKGNKVPLRQELRRDIMLGMDSGVLFGSVVSCSLLCMMFRAGSTGTDVNRAFTSYDGMVPLVVFGWIWPLL